MWGASPIVAIGEVANISAYGEQDVKDLPWPMSPGVRKLYWCVGDCWAAAVVKGKMRAASRTYLWASAQPGCNLWPDDPHLVYHRQKTRAWFLREEGEFLRPTFDGGTSKFIGLFTKWEDGPRLPARQRLGVLLLTPAANSDTLEDFAHYLWNVGDIACELLGKAECVRQIRNLASPGSATLRTEACRYLEGQQNTRCEE